MADDGKKPEATPDGSEDKENTPPGRSSRGPTPTRDESSSQDSLQCGVRIYFKEKIQKIFSGKKFLRGANFHWQC